MTKVVTFYNHKGGVSKTTTTFNVAHYLADIGKNVLVIDADPQCNLTEIMLAPLIDQLDTQEKWSGKEQTIEGTSLLDLLKPRIDGNVPEIDLSKVDTIKIKDHLELLKGDVDLSSIEDSLAEAHIQRFSNKTHEKRTYVAIADFLTRYGETNNIDYILIDVGPSSGALTRACFLACDGYFIPTAPDRFNVQAIGTLATIISKWIADHRQIVPEFEKLDLPIKHGLPKLLGVVLQNFKIRGGKPKPTYRMWMERIPLKVQSDLLPVLNNFNYEGYDLTCGLSGDEIVATKIRDFEGLAPLMQEHGKAMFNISQQDTAAMDPNGKVWSGQVWTGAEERMTDYRKRIQEIASRLEYLN
ncbi:ParA family protein [Vibrio parahaemolyticus]|uniref:ParA family protein n=1 Tax=Vibrio parahaemolyticus TaxID=670 RepID=UPI0004701718|nr:ParA family protein [Vibrio parahaemolyticus]EHK0751568.1 ParA family protein [Vibrio parahaemolyticus]EJB8573390.1 ParA family protein [Vibrio parahaemolyticus]EJE4175999.1 ParA family protein [Vibrio parahaemolyticus]ELB2951736.1 ParA family protein [Vibrio parahaemolyticus]MCR9782328.1 ParA family protein [Vibrio parahaemolyticus]